MVSSFDFFQNACMVYKHAYLNTLLLLHSIFMLSLVNMVLKGEVGGHELNNHGNYIVDCGKSWKNHGIVFLNFCGNPGQLSNNYTRELVGIQIGLEFLAETDTVKHKNIHILTDCQPAMRRAFWTELPRNKIEIILDIKNNLRCIGFLAIRRLREMSRRISRQNRH